MRLGLRENLGPFALLMVVNALVGAMVGMERSVMPAIAEQDFHLAARSTVLSFIIVFGVAKAFTNYGAGRLADHIGRKHVLVLGWLVAAPVPFLLMWASSWIWVLVANVLLGVSQGLTWSMTPIISRAFWGATRRARPRPVDNSAVAAAAAAAFSALSSRGSRLLLCGVLRRVLR